MSRSLNRATILGNLGSDPEVRSTSSGTRVATLSVATSRTWTDRNGNEKSSTQWHRVVAWEGLAEVCEQYLSKGDRVYIEGRIEYRQWEGDDGRTRYITEIRAGNLIMLGNPGGSQRRKPAPRDEEPEPDFTGDELMGGPTADDLPF